MIIQYREHLERLELMDDVADQCGKRLNDRNQRKRRILRRWKNNEGVGLGVGEWLNRLHNN